MKGQAGRGRKGTQFTPPATQGHTWKTYIARGCISFSIAWNPTLLSMRNPQRPSGSNGIPLAEFLRVTSPQHRVSRSSCTADQQSRKWYGSIKQERWATLVLKGLSLSSHIQRLQGKQRSWRFSIQEETSGVQVFSLLYSCKSLWLSLASQGAIGNCSPLAWLLFARRPDPFMRFLCCHTIGVPAPFLLPHARDLQCPTCKWLNFNKGNAASRVQHPSWS